MIRPSRRTPTAVSLQELNTHLPGEFFWYELEDGTGLARWMPSRFVCVQSAGHTLPPSPPPRVRAQPLIHPLLPPVRAPSSHLSLYAFFRWLITIHIVYIYVYQHPGEEEERAPFSSAPTAPPPLSSSSSSRLALAERALAEVTAQRDEALRLLESARHENTRLGAELERARSYKALYAAAHHVRFFFVHFLVYGAGLWCVYI